MTSAIETSNLVRRYGYRVALRDVSLKFSVGGIHGLFGANGAGKTTLMRVVSTLLRPHGGSISVLGFDPQEEPEDVKKRLGLVGDKPLLYEELTGLENLQFYSQLFGLDQDFFENQVEDLAKRFGVKTWLQEPVKNLSTGLKKRFDVIRSLIHDPELLLLDEPFSGLDKDTTEVFWEYLFEYRELRTTIVTTHNLAFGAALCDDYVTLRKGVVVSQGLISEFDQTL
ncbi:MAG: ABC transporter ATP-binding protein [Promethearchaeota archaeon]